MFYNQNTSYDQNTKQNFFQKFFSKIFLQFSLQNTENLLKSHIPFREKNPFKIGYDIMFAQDFQKIQKISKVVS